MPTYVFQDTEREGEYAEVDMAAGEAPSIGGILVHKGQVLRRIPVLPQFAVARRSRTERSRNPHAQVQRDASEFRVPQVERWHPGALQAGGHHDKTGVACFDSKRQLNEFLARDQRYVRDRDFTESDHES